jgi:two-component system sensor histidine kinase UhpB
VEGFSSAVHDENGQPTSFVVQILDITARKKAEKALQETTERLRTFSSRLQDVREEERTAIARELHDELGQAMTGLRMDLAMCSDKLPDGRADLQERLSQMIRLADENIALVQSISSQLRPPVLDVLGLGPAVEWLVEELARRSDLEFDLGLASEDIDLDPKSSIAAFRVVQEALTNVIRHAQAKKVRIRLSTFEDQLVAEIADDGVGIPADAIDHPRSIGLLGMSERAIAQGGSLEIEGEVGAGTRVLLALPLGGAPQGRKPLR